MTKMRNRILAILLMAVLCVTMVVVVVSFKHSSTIETQADMIESESATLRYETYDFSKYVEYYEKFSTYFEDDLLTWFDFVNTGTTSKPVWGNEAEANKMWDGTCDDENDILYAEGGDSEYTCYEYYGGYPSQLCTINFINNKRASFCYEFNVLESTMLKTPKKSQFATDEYMMVMVYAQANGGITSLTVYMNFTATGDDAMSLTDATSSQSDEFPTKAGYEDTIYCYTNLDLFDLDGQPKQTSSPLTYMLGDITSTVIADGGYTEEIFVGYAAFKVGENPSAGSITAYALNNPSGTFIGTNNISDSDIAKITESYPDGEGIITIKESDNTKAQLDTDKLKINNSTDFTTVASSSAASIEIDGTHLTTFIAKGQSYAPTTSIALDLYASFGGSIKDNTIKYCFDDPSGLDSGAGNTVSVSSNKATIPSSSLSDWGAGESVYVLVTVEAKTGSPKATTSYVIEVPKKKYDTKELTGLTITAGDVCTLCANGTSTPKAFESTTEQYTLRLSKTTSVTLSPTYATDVYQTVTIGGSNVASGGSKSVDVTYKTTASISIVVTAQDETTRTYTLNIYWLNDVVTLKQVTVNVYKAAVSPVATSTLTSGKITYNDTSKEYSLSGKDNVPYDSGRFEYSAVVTDN